MRQILNWSFRNRETGAITIAQWPNLMLWIVMAGILPWIWPPGDEICVALTVVFKGKLAEIQNVDPKSSQLDAS